MWLISVAYRHDEFAKKINSPRSSLRGWTNLLSALISVNLRQRRFPITAITRDYGDFHKFP
jgi:hypothetical protein